ncbi:MAG: DUF2585 family protein [bacterium]
MNLETEFSRTTYAFLCSLLFLILALILFLMDRPLYCTCGYVKLWQPDVFHPQVSQHLTDWYTFTHLAHGFLLYFLLTWLIPDVPAGTKLLLVIALEGSWEIIENTEYVIEYYRNNTMAVKYFGDTILNSLSDTLAMALAFSYARYFSVRTTALTWVGVEVLTIYMIRDSFLLNVLMFVYPIEAIKTWQMALM